MQTRSRLAMREKAQTSPTVRVMYVVDNCLITHLLALKLTNLLPIVQIMLYWTTITIIFVRVGYGTVAMAYADTSS